MHERRFRPDSDLNLRSKERLELLEVDRVVDLTLEGLAAKTLLDVGTGSGVFAEAFTELGLGVCGVDVSPRMLAKAREIVPHISFQVAIAENLPYRWSSFDIVFMSMVLHETDALQALSEARRVAVKRVSILEWRDGEHDSGPPRSHRLLQDTVSGLAHQAGFPGMVTIPLNTLVLYRLNGKG